MIKAWACLLNVIIECVRMNIVEEYKWDWEEKCDKDLSSNGRMDSLSMCASHSSRF